MGTVGTLGIVGCGRLGEAVLAGLLSAGVVAPEDVTVTVRRSDHAEELAQRHGVRATTDNPTALAADVVVLGLKPQVLPGVLEQHGTAVRGRALVVSLAAGTSTTRLDQLLPAAPAIVRVMTNTPALVGAATSVVCAGPRATQRHLRLVEQLVAPLGDVRVLPESAIDAVTAVSGSGPAYVFLLAEALAEAGVHVGLAQADAEALANATVAGAGALLVADRGSAAELREQVTSPGGTTAAALQVLEQAGLRAAVQDAVTAAVARARELG